MFVISLQLMLLTVFAHDIQNRQFIKFGDKKEATGGQLETVQKLTSLTQCSSVCSKDVQCMGVSFSRILSHCQKLKNVSEDNLTPNMDYSVWKKVVTCQDKPCNNGSCYDNDTDGYRCECLPGYVGLNCEETPSNGYQYHNGSYFKYYEIVMSQPAAEDRCNQEGARLAQVPNLSVHEFLKELISVNKKNTWIGLRRVNGTWNYASSEFRVWEKSEPPPDTKDECVEMSGSNLEWKAENCADDNNNYVCELINN
ncbi:uncharacterized protein LOC143257949 [Tachypleus tridentatus]|uniref:uncharacterized protein LOC143257949 n=1 Tax=Tachypleus tridentatus TaxID=6853 RepID=UPI003FCF4C06